MTRFAFLKSSYRLQCGDGERLQDQQVIKSRQGRQFKRKEWLGPNLKGHLMAELRMFKVTKSC